MNKVKKFKSKIGWVVPLIYIFFAGVIVALWLAPIYARDAMVIRISFTCFFAGILALFTWAVFRTYYMFTEDKIIIVSGPLLSKVSYNTVTDVKTGFSMISSGSLSFDRVIISRGKNFLRRVYISPKDKEGFVEELKSRCPQLADKKESISK